MGRVSETWVVSSGPGASPALTGLQQQRSKSKSKRTGHERRGDMSKVRSTACAN